MCKRGVQVVGLEGCVSDEFLVGMVVDGPHQGQALNNHYYDDADVIGKGHEQTAEIVGLDHGLLAIEVGDFCQAPDQRGHIRFPEFGNLFGGHGSGPGELIEHHRDKHVAVGRHHLAQGYPCPE